MSRRTCSVAAGMYKLIVSWRAACTPGRLTGWAQVCESCSVRQMPPHVRLDCMPCCTHVRNLAAGAATTPELAPQAVFD